MHIERFVGQNLPCHDKWELFDEVIDHYFDTAPRRLLKVSLADRYPHMEEAIAICDSCPLKDVCREAGRTEVSGIWGGRIAGT